MTATASEAGRLSVGERLNEVAELLAVGFLRLASRENARNPRDFGEYPLDFAGQASVHGTARNCRGERP